ncbi:regulatory protein RecX [Enterococcus faecalis 13-SD-W-01]|nr:regulatory protein RecX [Enterococcus faecalis 13-SD-W-01]
MITIVRVGKEKGPFYQVELSDGRKLRVSEDRLVHYRLLKGMELEPETIEEIEKNSQYDYGLQQAMNYLSYQLRSEKEIHTYLRDKEIDKNDRDRIVQRLKELDLIDDRMYGESYVRTQMRLSDKGPRKIAQALQQKGISPEKVEQALLEYPEEEQLNAAIHAAEKAVGKYRGRSHRETLQKTRQALMNKGFSSEIIQQAIDSLESEPDEEEEYQALVTQGDKLWRKHQRLNLSKKKQKVKQSLYQKGFSLEEIQRFIDEKEEQDE